MSKISSLSRRSLERLPRLFRLLGHDAEALHFVLNSNVRGQ
jgi:hypothetical protein